MEKVNREVDGTVAFFTARLEEYFDSVPHKASKTMESYTLPGGKLVRKRQQPQYETDDEALVPWLETNMAQLVKIKKSADWAALKKLCSVTPDGQHVVTEDGEIIPGVTVTQHLFVVDTYGVAVIILEVAGAGIQHGNAADGRQYSGKFLSHSHLHH